jgi:hypothetical protein
MLPGVALANELLLGRAPPEVVTADPLAFRGPWKILEIFVRGGLSHQETLWLTRASSAWPVVRSPFPELPRSCEAPCFQPTDLSAFLPAPHAEPQLVEGDVYVSGALAPLWDPAVRADLWDRCRLMITHTGWKDHVMAQAHALAVAAPGRPGHLGLAACANHAFGSGSGWVVDYRGETCVAPATAIDGLDVAARPPVVPIGSPDFKDAALGYAAGVGAQGDLLEVYRVGFADRIQQGRGLRALDDAYAQALSLDLLSDLPPLVGARPQSWDDSDFRQAIRVGAALLKAPTPRVATVLIGNLFGSADTHKGASMQDHADLAGRRWWALVDEVRALAAGGELDLLQTLVVIRSEFGRSIEHDDDGGSGHMPESTPVLLLGGPIVGRGLVGSASVTPEGPVAVAGIDPHSEVAGPRDLRAVLLTALGVKLDDPQLAPSLAGTSLDVPDPVASIASHVFGRSPSTLLTAPYAP